MWWHNRRGWLHLEAALVVFSYFVFGAILIGSQHEDATDNAQKIDRFSFWDGVELVAVVLITRVVQVSNSVCLTSLCAQHSMRALGHCANLLMFSR